MSAPDSLSSRAESTDHAEKLISCAAVGIAIELVLFKFLPDLSTAVIQHGQSGLTDFTLFKNEYLTAGSVHHARFLGNYLLYWLATLLTSIDHSSDLRLHPLRVATGILTPLYAWLGTCLVLKNQGLFEWRRFFVPYALMVLIGLYVFYPADLPSLAFLSLALLYLLRERLGIALLLMLLTGLFRETSFHMVWLVAAWAWSDRCRGWRERILWVVVFALAFVLEYVAVRRFFPGPVTSAGAFIVDPRTLFFDRGLVSLTTICSVGLAVLFPIACFLRVRHLPADDWRREFFILNCYVFPAWLLFYRMMNGNLSEFRMFFPVLLPCIYGIAYRPREPRLQCA